MATQAANATSQPQVAGEDDSLSTTDLEQIRQLVDALEARARRAQDVQPRMSFTDLCHLLRLALRGQKGFRIKL